MTKGISGICLLKRDQLLSYLQGHYNLVIFSFIFIVMHKSGTKYLQSFVAFKRDEIGRTHLVLSKHEI